MKRTVILAGGMVALGLAIYVGRLWAQTGTQSPRPAAVEPRTRIALLNLHYVIKNYKKYVTFQEEIKRSIQPLQQRDQAKRAELEALSKEAQGTTLAPDRRDAIEKKAKDLQRELEDIKAEANKFLGKKADEQLKILYMDVQDVAQRYATAHSFELVLHYNDATTKEEYYSTQNISRKLQAGACMPMYAAPGMDISQEVLTTLNAAYAGPVTPAAGTPAATTTTPAGTAPAPQPGRPQ